MFSIFSFLQGGLPIFEKGDIEKQRDDLQRGRIRPPRKLRHMAQGWSKACIFCPYV